jgi:CheY-like chemotaxis protein
MHAPRSEPKTVLIADDDAWLRDVLATLLAEEGLQPLEAASGTEAVHMARRNHPDLILLDVAMPGRTGIEVLDALRTRDSTRDIPVLLVSGEINLVDTGHAYEARAALHKPLDFGALLSKIQEAIRS